MEERSSPPNGDENHDPLRDQQTISPTQVPDHQPLPETSHRAFRSGTYVVQVPKDQIYRVPPPEHALLAERHRNFNRPKMSCCCRFLCVFVPIIVILLILGLIGGITFILLKQEDPEFSIEHVLVKNVPIHHKQQRPEYDVTVKAENPNKYTRILHGQDGDASLSFKQKEIAVGKYPNFDQAPKNSTAFKIVLHGSNVALPREVERSMNSTASKVHVSLALGINVSVRAKIWVFKFGSKEISVACNLTLDRLAKNTRVLSQKCRT
ncbi:hypothetical protein RJ639_004195 [Escallonia herrerae]|uniref:Late embryogenesis abundant protein LEA-2 subgroup domain-containing protein n=1 Tax=Escallonia herrerae TaxID=1293975 RepID=A0AA88W319_9ASTE|nr:hypothetical protein RJ639_004195 [Escallonia herrerae]